MATKSRTKTHPPPAPVGSLCLGCGRCCWDWKNNDPTKRCQHLAEDLRTCLVYGRRNEVNRPECDNLMDPHQACDLHPDCGYMKYWKAQGML